MCANASLTIQDALEKEKSQYPHAPLRSISKLMLFLLLSTHSFFLLFPLLFFQVNCNERKGSLQISLPLSRPLSILHVVKKMKRRRFELFPAADCLLVQREIVYDPQLRV